MLQHISKSRAVERAACAAVLRTAGPGDVITYDQIKAASQVDPIAERHILVAARNELRDEEGILFEPITGVGLRRMTEIEVATIAPGRRRRKAHQQAKIGLRELATIADPAKLPDGERLQYFAASAVLGVIVAVGTNKAVAHIERKIAQAGPTLPLAETLEALKGVR